MGECTTFPGSNDSIITLAEAASLLGVHYMTAYRYVRTGILAAVKVGPRWQVELTAIEAMKQRPPIIPTGAGTRSERWKPRVLRRVLALDDAGAWQAIEAAMAAGLEPLEVYTDILIPVVSQIGSEWENGALDVAHEHAATSVCHRLSARLGSIATRRGRTRGTVVFGCPAGEHHHLAATIAADIFRASGYSTINCGADVPAHSFARLLSRTPNVVAAAVSITSPSSRPSAARTIRAIRQTNPGLIILLGGGGVDATAHLGADHVALTAIDGVRYLDNTRPKPLPNYQPSALSP